MTWQQACCIVVVMAAVMGGLKAQDTDRPCITCLMFCDYGFVNGSDGCPLCKCADPPNPWVPCQGYDGCFEGYKCNNLQVECVTEPCYPVVHCIEFPRDGCPMPNNDELHCMLVRVGRFCESDNQCDQGEICCEGDCGGSYCKAAPEPVCPAANNDPDHCALVDPRYDCETDEQCDAGETCCEGDCTGRYCKAMETLCKTCRIFCAYGFVMGQDGCPLCECHDAPNPWMPCEGFDGCSKSQVCENQDVQCVTEPCYPVPNCIEEEVTCPRNFDETYLGGCDEEMCESNYDCDPYMACCYNGCAHVCTTGDMTADSDRLMMSATFILVAALVPFF